MQTLRFSLIYNVTMIGLLKMGLVGPLAAAIVLPLGSLISLGIVMRASHFPVRS